MVLRPKFGQGVVQLLLLGALCGAGCAHRVAIDTDPSGAALMLGDRYLGDAPVEVRLWWWPFRPLPIEASLPEHRDITISVGKDAGILKIMFEIITLRYRVLLGLEPRSHHEILLIREHQGVGTWTPEDAG